LTALKIELITTTEDYDHMLSKEQKVELMDLANLELSEVKPITKSDVVVGVIVGAVVGASMAAYLFITNGAI
jgi:capsular polysaccharide biosynthesis protein